MNQAQTKTLAIFAPAKINLYLHVTKRLDDGYHALDSLIAFSDIGDAIEIEPAAEFEFHVQGPYAKIFTPKELDASPDSSNIVAQAVWAMARAAQKIPKLRVTLTKNLPLASGVGGGSSDAASVIWGLCEWWDIPKNAPFLPALMKNLGADVPVCLHCRPARARGIGDILDPAPAMPEIPIALVNPGRSCSTAEIFARFAGPYSAAGKTPEHLENLNDFAAFLKTTRNDLQAPAMEIAPEINEAVRALEAQKSCAFARMSGSGATCFGLFESEAAAQKAAKSIAAKYSEWWVKAGWLNRPERY